MENTRFTSSLFAGLFALMFVASMAVSGCSTGELAGPDTAEPAVEMYRPAGDAAHNNAQSTRNGGSNGGSTDPVAGHNETNEDRDMHN